MTAILVLAIVLISAYAAGLVWVLRTDSTGHAPSRSDAWAAGRLPDHPYAEV